ncbi:beta-propeller fold lactonase family protein [Pseudoalteromonas rubra]|nr:beta-propeller fold lactonase family protein [Pseudoalteromonas rubra]
MMERRTFLKTSSYLCASGALPLSAFAANSTLFDFSEQNTQRLDVQTVNKLAVKAPKMSVEAPSGERVSVTLKPAVARRYDALLYVHYEMSNEITVFDINGVQQGTIGLPDGFGSVSDFAIEPSQQLVYLIERGHHQIIVANFYGERLAHIGEFGTEVAAQLNGPRSLTLDDEGHVHVVDSGASSIKVFNNNGAFLYAYGQSRLGKAPIYRALDGTQHVVVTGGQLGDRKWFFDSSIRKLSALN